MIKAILIMIMNYLLLIKSEKNFKEYFENKIGEEIILKGYITYSEYKTIIVNLSKDYSKILTLEEIGITYEGNKIDLIKIKTNNLNNKGILFTGIH